MTKYSHSFHIQCLKVLPWFHFADPFLSRWWNGWVRRRWCPSTHWHEDIEEEKASHGDPSLSTCLVLQLCKVFSGSSSPPGPQTFPVLPCSERSASVPVFQTFLLYLYSFSKGFCTDRRKHWLYLSHVWTRSLKCHFVPYDIWIPAAWQKWLLYQVNWMSQLWPNIIVNCLVCWLYLLQKHCRSSCIPGINNLSFVWSFMEVSHHVTCVQEGRCTFTPPLHF